MPVCRFFLKGYCRFGDNCRFEHPTTEEDSYYIETPKINFSFRSPNQHNNTINNFQQQHSYSNNYSTTTTPANSFSFKSAVQNQSTNFHQSYNNNTFNQSFNSNNSFTSSPLNFSFKQPIAQASSAASWHDDVDMSEESQRKKEELHRIEELQRIEGLRKIEESSFIKKEVTTTTTSGFSNIDELTTLELEAFKREKFEFCKIPIRPPPKAYC